MSGLRDLRPDWSVLPARPNIPAQKTFNTNFNGNKINENHSVQLSQLIDLYLIDQANLPPHQITNIRICFVVNIVVEGVLSLHLVLLGAGHVHSGVVGLLARRFTAPDLFDFLLAAGVCSEEIIWGGRVVLISILT